MSFLFPIVAAILQTVSFTLDKIVLSVKQVGFQTYIGVSFPFSFFVNLALFFIFHPLFPEGWFEGYYGLLLLGGIGISFLTNILFYRALDHDKLGEIETLSLLNAVPVIVVSSIVFADERNFAITLPALVASVAVVWSHWERHHIKIARDTLPYLCWSLAITPVSALISKELLTVWNPIALEMVRTGALAALFLFMFRDAITKIPVQALRLLIITNVLTTVALVLFYFGYQRLGIVHTLLLFSLQPFLVYLASIFILKERPSWKRSVAFAVVLVSIAIAELLGSRIV
ncbi:MAG: hypothetical protein A3J54_00625 [Candidatus Ryanbacteria bacterium RIFCSPHIGHO2_02_FULL_45_13b]|uniref:EamA domain-containing protein n=1 Tax=Candidatus Ryanbacteria bacterium RIFCSPHIGHO2_02_FULL_45_13b TaxID=1802117 RepID=A0A1G2G3I2_9BACT|nr:MAG: hypothetical protein A3J54_00625 [Candidatus Ryanbacteria bacterium RIFCSPHIGHO2_02_FULL_45_13b]